MSIERIDYDLCTGCGRCVKTCTVDVIRLDEQGKKPVIKYPEECMTCGYCEIDCPQGAIYVSSKTYVPVMLGWR
jgi:NAD-dependent dihydropyrimidine dehydrogenase PreA subunit